MAARVLGDDRVAKQLAEGIMIGRERKRGGVAVQPGAHGHDRHSAALHRRRERLAVGREDALKSRE